MKIYLTCLLLLASLSLFGCEGPVEGQKQTAGTTGTQTVDFGEPVTGGRIIEAMLGEPSNMISVLSSDSASHTVSSHIYVSPLKYDKDINLVPYAAEHYEVLDGGRLLRFKLREDIRWFDGKPLTAEDVEFTYKLMVDPKTPTAYAEDYKIIKEFRLTGPYSFEVVYDKPFARALITWAHDILPRHALENEDLLNTKYSREPLGAGPYKLKEWVSGRHIVLEANEDYFEGRPYIDQVVYRFIPDQSTQFLELKAGNLDTMGLSPQQYLYQTSGLDWDGNFQKFKYLSFGYTYLGYNLKNPMFSDVRVRKAFAHAINKEELVKGVLLGLGVPAQGPYKPGTWVYNDKIVPYEFDPGKARALLAEAGWTDTDNDGLLDKDGKPFAFTILTNQGNTERIKTATIIQERLKNIGIKIDVRTVEWAAFLKEFIDPRRFEATILGWNILQDPELYDVWHSSRDFPGGLNFVGYRNQELDDLLEQGRRLLEQDKRKPIYDRLQEILHEEQPYCFLYLPMALPIVQARIQGIEPAPAGIAHNFNRWWVPESLQRSKVAY